MIEKRLKLSLFGRDVYLNVVGGLRISEPSSDLAVAVSIVSSLTGNYIIYMHCTINKYRTDTQLLFLY